MVDSDFLQIIHYQTAYVAKRFPTLLQKKVGENLKFVVEETELYRLLKYRHPKGNFLWQKDGKAINSSIVKL